MNEQCILKAKDDEIARLKIKAAYFEALVTDKNVEIDALKKAVDVAESMIGNPHLKSADDTGKHPSTRSYQVQVDTDGSLFAMGEPEYKAADDLQMTITWGVDTDIEFADYMFWRGVAFQSESEYCDMDAGDMVNNSIAEYKAQKEKTNNG